jgi:HAMP domain-containing protein
MSGEVLYGAFCVGWMVIGGIMLTAQLFSRLRGIEQLRQLQFDETSILAEIEAEIKTAEADANEVELQAKTLRRMIRIWEQRLEASSAVRIATVAIPLAGQTVIDAKLRGRPGFE